ncbi:MAG: hypothetical protein WDO13_01010 [Verrucomicrobiota bacterium]
MHEGLLQYLSSTETEALARHIRELLGSFGGEWITPDLSLKADAEGVSERQRQFQSLVVEATERTLYNNRFEDVEHVRTYFGRLGFQLEVFSQLYLAPELVSLQRLHLRPELLEELRPRLRVWVLKPR